MGNNEYLSVRIDSKLKSDFYNFCQNSGISVSAAVNMLARKCIDIGSLPFIVNVVDYDTKQGGVSLRISIRMKKEIRDGFSTICDRIGVPMSTVVKMFMLQCVDKDCFPFT